MKLFRILSFALALLMLVGVLAACGKKDDGGDDTTAAPASSSVTTEENIYGTLGKKDWNGRTFTVLGTYANTKTGEIVALDTETDTYAIGEQVTQRNEELEELFNVEIVLADQATRYYTGDNSVCYNAFVEDLESGLVTYDLIFAYRDDMSSIIVNHYLYDLNEVDHIDFTQDYYAQVPLAALSLAGKQYVAVSDFTVTDKTRVSAMWFNVDMRKQFKLDDPIALTRAGNWTWEEFRKGEVVVADLNDDGNMIYSDDRYLVGIGSNDEVVGYYIGLGGKYFELAEDGSFDLAYNSPTSNAVIDKIKQVFGTTGADRTWYGSQRSDSPSYNGAYSAFCSNRMLWHLGFVTWGYTYLNEEADFEFNCTPIPKFDAKQETYLSNSNHRFSVTVGIPKMTGVDTDFSGFMFEALSWKGGPVVDQLINVTCKLQGAYNADCAEMIALCFDTVTYEQAFTYDEPLKANGNSPKNVISKSCRDTDGTTTVSNFYKKDADAQMEKLSDLITALLEIKK